MEVEVANKHGMPGELFTLCHLQQVEGSLELDTSPRGLVERLKVARRNDKVVWNARLSQDQRTAHIRLKVTLVKVARILRDHDCAVGAEFVLTYAAALVQDVLDVCVFHEVLHDGPRHLLQADKFGVTLLYYLEHRIDSLFSHLIEPNVVGEDLDKGFSPLSRPEKVLHLQRSKIDFSAHVFFVFYRLQCTIVSHEFSVFYEFQCAVILRNWSEE